MSSSLTPPESVSWPLSKKAQVLEDYTYQRHMLEGQVLSLLVPPPQCADDWSSGNYENNCSWTGMLLAAQSWRYKVTNDPDAKRKADEHAEALMFLHDIVPQPGICARGWRYQEGTSWDEDFFWRIGPMSTRSGHEEWHQEGSRRWVSDFSSDQLDEMFFGLSVYADYAADEDQQRRIGEHMRVIMGRIIDWRMRIMDVDGRPTTWGNLCPDILEEDLNALIAIAVLKSTFAWSGDGRVEDTFRWLIDDHDYAQKASRANPSTDPHKTNHSDDILAAVSFYMAIRYDDDPEHQKLYRRGMARVHERMKGEGNALFSFLYHNICGAEFDDQDSVETLKEFSTDTTMRETINSTDPDIDRNSVSIDSLQWVENPSPIPQWRRPRKEFEWAGNPYRIDGHYGMQGGLLGESVVSGVDYLVAYWLGRFSGFLSEDD